MINRIIHIFLCLLVALASYAQETDPEDLDIKPLSLNPKYKDIIKPKELEPSYTTKSFNNDSLLKVTTKINPFVDSSPSGYGKEFDKDMWFKQLSHKFELDTGTVWLFKAVTLTGKSLAIGLDIDSLDIPKSAQLSYFFYEENYDQFHHYTHGCYEVNLMRQKYLDSDNQELYIEYFEPKEFKSNYDFKIKRWMYRFADRFQKNDKNLSLKNGVHGTTIKNKNCKNDIYCNDPDWLIPHWREMSSSVFYLYLFYEYDYLDASYENIKHASGYFINKGNDYKSKDRPFLLSALHNFQMKRFDNSIIDLTKLSKSSYTRRLYIDYKNDICESEKKIKGRRLLGDINIIDKGEYLTPQNPNFDPSNDYILLQFNRNMKIFSQYGVLFPGWKSNISVNSPPGVATFGHPQGDVMKICIDDDEIELGIADEHLQLFFDIGIGESGMSGGPIFNKNKDLIGWSSTCDKSPGNCGGNDKILIGGNFERLYPKIQKHIDPNYFYFADKKTYENFTPEHCHNCMQDRDKYEQGVDCGGDCKPCYVPRSLVIRNEMDFMHNKSIKASRSVHIDLDENVVSPNTLSISSGDHILLERNITFDNNEKDLSIYIDNRIVENFAPRKCDAAPCIIVGNVASPNGDGKNDYLPMSQTSVRRYRVKIFEARSGKLIYQSGMNYLDNDGVVPIYDPKKLRPGVYGYQVEAWNCNGQKISDVDNFHIFK